ncbi:MAG TPA: PepSY domain-containing protein [Rhizomicrobium sp.]|jgi:uncharacterized membrane protein YkoI
MKDILLATPAVLMTALTATASIAAPSSYSGHELEKNAKITMAKATTIATRARPGEVTDRELEREGGGSGLRYSFDIKSAGTTYEVGVDAMTGKVLENSKEGPNPD